MPRSIRIEYPGAFYHVMARGNRREAIFADEDDRRIFLKTLGEACAMTGWPVHASKSAAIANTHPQCRKPCNAGCISQEMSPDPYFPERQLRFDQRALAGHQCGDGQQ